MTPIKRAQLFAMDAVYLPHRHVFAESTEFRTINTKGRRAGISAVTWGEAAKNGGMTPRALPPKKQPRLPAWYPSLHCSSFADDQLALAKDQIIYVSAGEVVYHLCYHFLSLLFSFLVYHILYKKQVKFLLTPPTGSAGVRLGCPIPRRAAGGNDQRGMGKSA